MRKPKRRESTGIFPNTPAPRLARFGTGEAARFLGIRIWRLQKFLDSPKYNLSPEGQLGEGHGSRRLFSVEDLYRMAIASAMVEDGFTAKVIGSVVRQIEDYDLSVETYEDKELPPARFMGLVRTSKGPQVALYDAKSLPRFGKKGSPYYVLDIAELTGRVIQRIAKSAK